MLKHPNKMGSIATNLQAVCAGLPSGVELVAISKFHPVEDILEAYNAGQRIFGESRVMELVEKIEALPDDIRWHFIGHLQTNKLKHIIGKVSMIESVDSFRLLRLIDDMSDAKGIVTRVLMQVHVAAEETKYGFDPDELVGWFESRGFERLRATHICGIMGMATNTDDHERVAADFRRIADISRRILEVAPDLRDFNTLSMGMSGDYKLAIEAGSNLVRIGTAIFGKREY